MNNKLEVYRLLCNSVLDRRLSAEILCSNIQTAEEMLLFVNCYKELGYTSFTHQVRKGLKYAFNNLNLTTSSEQDLHALQDIINKVHPKPSTTFHVRLFRAISLGVPIVW